MLIPVHESRQMTSEASVGIQCLTHTHVFLTVGPKTCTGLYTYKNPAYTRMQTLAEYGYINNSYPCNTHISTQTVTSFHSCYRLSIKSLIRFVTMVIISGWLDMGCLWCFIREFASLITLREYENSGMKLYLRPLWHSSKQFCRPAKRLKEKQEKMSNE